jgi:hypothetical protein
VVQVAALQPLLAFLQVEPYGQDELLWRDAIRTPFEAGRVLGAHCADCVARNC